jgi:hypothetical protein
MTNGKICVEELISRIKKKIQEYEKHKAELRYFAGDQFDQVIDARTNTLGWALIQIQKLKCNK